MADPRIPTGPIITQETIDKAQSDKLTASLKALGMGAAGTELNRRANAPGGPIAQGFLRNLVTGVHVTPSPTGRGSVSIGKSTIIGALLPAPYGYVPPETYGLHPSFTEKAVGGRIPAGATFGFRGSDARVQVYEAKEYIAALTKRIEGYRGFVAQSVAEANKNLEPLPGLTVADYVYLKSLPTGATRLQFYVTQYALQYEAILAQIEADALAAVDRAFAVGQRVEGVYFDGVTIRTGRAPAPQFDGDALAALANTTGANPAQAAITDGYALRVAAAKKSMDP